MRLGLVVRADNSGLGTVSREFFDHLQPDRVVVIDNGAYQTFPERYGGIKPILAQAFDAVAIRQFLEGLDCVLTIETPYNWAVFTIAREMGVKTILMPMYECLSKNHVKPDLYICPSKLDLDEVDGKKIYLPCPINTDRVKFRMRKKANVFVHNAGHGGLVGRNGTDIFIKAIPLVKSREVRFVIRSQAAITLPYDDERVEVQFANFRNYWDLWNLQGDVFVFPHKFDGLSLPVQEALASGMPLITTAMYPFNKWLPTDFLVAVESQKQIRLSREITASFVSPRTIAERIDELAGQDIRQLSTLAGGIGEDLSWAKWLAPYEDVIEQLCANEL